MKRASAVARILLIFFFALSLHARPPSNDNTIYDSDPKHLWNRLRETLFARSGSDNKTYGLDELDILYWPTTRHLLVEPSHQQALTILDEFISTHGEKLIQEPFKRALLQRDLWWLFDWSAEGWSWRRDDRSQRRALQQRLVVAIRRLALTTNEIAALSDNYAQAVKEGLPDLPRGLFQTNSDWVSVGINGDTLAAEAHVRFFHGHSALFVMVRLPDGRESTESYLDSLRRFERVWTYETNRSRFNVNEPRYVMVLSSNLTQFPTNTEWALVRRMCVIDTEGHIQPTRITEGIQLRRYIEIQRKFSKTAQQFFEFEMDRRRNGALRTIGPDEKGFVFLHFMSQGIDLFELEYRGHSNETFDSDKLQQVRLQTCFQCHSASGIFSVNSYTRALSVSSEKPAALTPLGTEREATLAVYWKQRQFDWGLLQGLWSQGN